MTREVRCNGMNTDGTRCNAPASLVDPKKRLCPSHDPANREKLREAGRRGAASLHRRYAAKGMNSDELPPLTSPEVAEIWLERIARAVATGGLPHNDARAATTALQQWLKAHEAGRMADKLETLREQLEKLKAVR